MRGADPAIVLVPGVGMFSFGANKQTARVAGEFYVNAINVMRGAESVSTYEPIAEAEKFRIEYWALEEAKLQRLPAPKPLATRIAFVTGAGSGIGRRDRAPARRGGCLRRGRRCRRRGSAATVADEIGSADVAVAVAVDVTDSGRWRMRCRATMLAFGGVDLVVNNAGLSISKPLLETTEADWDLQHDVMAKGSFLVSREAARVMIEQGMGGDLIYISSKNAVVAGPNNVGYGAAKADQAHQVRLLAAESRRARHPGERHQPRWGRARLGHLRQGMGSTAGGGLRHPRGGVGVFYAQRTLLKREVLPEHVAAAVFALTAGDLALTTGLHVPVDVGVAAAFLR